MIGCAGCLAVCWCMLLSRPLWSLALPSRVCIASSSPLFGCLQVMTNMRPKTYFLRPDVAIPLGFALLREIWQQKVRCCALCRIPLAFLVLSNCSLPCDLPPQVVKRPDQYVMPAEAK